MCDVASVKDQRYLPRRCEDEAQKTDQYREDKVTGTDLAQRVQEIITPTVEALGYDIVRVLLLGGGDPRLQIMAEPMDGREMNVDDCADISRAVSAVLDVEDPISDAYTLEVSSPGLDRPLVRLKDFDRFAGFEAKLETKTVIDGRRRFRGRVTGTDGNDVVIDVDGERVQLHIDDIAKAKLIVTDEMIAQLGKEKAS